MLKQYIRDKKNNPVGVMIAELRGLTIHLGWSICNKKDTYSKKKGEMIAMNRLKDELMNADSYDRIPKQYSNQIKFFEERYNKYFANKTNKGN